MARTRSQTLAASRAASAHVPSRCPMDPTNQPVPFPFLNLPLPFRDLVYKKLFKGITASPPSFAAVPQERREVTKYIRFPFFPEDAIASSLLLVNHQVSAEVLEVLKAPSCNPLMYTLDCIQLLDDEDMLYPTWLSAPVPLLSSNLDVLMVNFRLDFGNFLGRDSDLFKKIEDSGVALFRNLLLLLTRFLSRGVDFLSALKPHSAKIGLVVLNVISSDECSLGYHEPVLREGPRTPLAEVIVLEVAREIKNFVLWYQWREKSLHFSFHDKMYEILQIMGENVETIMLSVDGQVRKVIAVALQAREDFPASGTGSNSG